MSTSFRLFVDKSPIKEYIYKSFNTIGVRDMLLQMMNRHHTILCDICNDFRDKMVYVSNMLHNIRDGANFRYSFTYHKFIPKSLHMIDNNLDLFVNKERRRTYILWYISNEPKIKKEQMYFHIMNIDTFYYNEVKLKKYKLSLELITLLQVLKYVLCIKIDKSYKSFYKFLNKIENHQLKSFRKKQISKIIKRKLKKINTMTTLCIERDSICEKMRNINEQIKVSYSHSDRIKRIKDKLILLFTHYIEQLQQMNVTIYNEKNIQNIAEIMNKEQFEKDIAIYIPSMKESRKFINILPDNIYYDITKIFI